MAEEKYSFSEVYYSSSDAKTNIHACIWQPAREVRAVLQIVHGMAEYAERYANFAVALAERGVLVCAEDHLGHGKSVSSEKELGYFADKKGYGCVLEDIRTLAKIVSSKYQGVPYFMLGHSMGSFFARKYVSLYGNELSGAIIMGTGYKDGLTTGAGKFLCSLIALFKGWHHISPFIDNLAFGAYNKRFGGRTKFDWLSKDEGNADAYIADPLCGIPFTLNGFYALFDVLGAACAKKTVAATPSALPVLFVSGADDPVGDYSKGVQKVYKKFRKLGKNAQIKLYDGCRHEILNDISREQVVSDIISFIEANLTK